MARWVDSVLDTLSPGRARRRTLELQLAQARTRMLEVYSDYRKEVRARYDAADTNHHNSRHWAAADGLSAASANSPEVRRVLRNRARYETANNTYAKGIAKTVANDTVGTGPRLQVTHSENEDENDQVEQAFADWASDADIGGKLNTMRRAKISDGESFAIITTNPNLQSPVKLDLRLVEADQIATPYPLFTPTEIDGIRFDSWGNPESYYLLNSHPGDGRGLSPLDYQVLPARSVLHYFDVERPGQVRGIPEITPALPLFSQLRRFTLASLEAAEIVANLALVIYTKTAAPDAKNPKAGQFMELNRGEATFLPDGWELGQTKAEQPTTTYQMFKREVLGEIARCLCVPYNVAACDSAGHNFSSGRLDHQPYHKAVKIERWRIVRIILERLFAEFIAEASLIGNLIPRSFRNLNVRIRHKWFWDGFGYVDPENEAKATKIALETHTTTLADVYGEQGLDYRDQLKQSAKEQQFKRELKITPADIARDLEKVGAEEPASA